MDYHLERSKVPAQILSIAQSLGLPVVDPEKIKLVGSPLEDLATRLCSLEGSTPVPLRSRLYYIQKGESLIVFSYFFQGAKPGRALGALFVGVIPRSGWATA